MVLSSAILLGFADSTKMAGKLVGLPAEKPNLGGTQPNLQISGG